MGWSTRSRKPHYKSLSNKDKYFHIEKRHKIYNTRLYTIHKLYKMKRYMSTSQHKTISILEKNTHEYLLDPSRPQSGGDEQPLLDPPLLYLCRTLWDALDLVAPAPVAAGGVGGGGPQRADRAGRRTKAGVWLRRATSGWLRAQAGGRCSRLCGRRQTSGVRPVALAEWAPVAQTEVDGVRRGTGNGGRQGRRGMGSGPVAPGAEGKGPAPVG